MDLFIGNLDYRVKEFDLWCIMECYGTITSVKVIMDRETNRSKGYAFVKMPNESEARAAIKDLNGAKYVHRTMVVREASPKA